MFGLILIFTASLTVAALAQSSISIQLQKDFLNFPVSYDEDDFTRIEIEIDGKGEIYFDIFLADSTPNFWVFRDISAFKGKNAIIKAHRKDKADALKAIYQSDERKYLKNLYHEKHRPR